jgi:hypothetical protein
MFEECVGVSIEDFIRQARAHGMHSVLTPEQADAACNRIVASYKGKTPPMSRPSHLTPVLYDSDWNYGALSLGFGIPPPRAFPSVVHIRHSLLYSHAVYLEDPLPQILGYYSRRYPYHESILLSTLSKLHDLRPLIKADIVQLTRASNRQKDITEKLDSVLEDPSFLLFLRSIGVWGPHSRNASHTSSLRILGQRSKVVDRASELIQYAWAMEILGGAGQAWVHDMERALRSFEGTKADLWFPSERHARFYAGFQDYLNSEHGPPDVYKETDLDRIMSVDIPSISMLSARDIAGIRQSSDIFEDWRRALSTTLSMSASSNYTNNREAIGAEMTAVAEDMHRKLQSGRAEIATGAVRSFFLAAVGFAGSAPITGWGNWPSMLAGTAAVGAGGAALDAKKKRNHHVALAAARRHALLLSEATESN